MIQDGVSWERTIWEPTTEGKDSGLWLTPKAQNANGPGLHGEGGMDLQTKVSIWPTPTKADHYKGNLKSSQQKKGSRHSLDLPSAVKMYPTPDANIRGARKNQNGHQTTLQDTIGSGQLNPTWVEWLMGWPLGWTDLKPLETDRFRQWLEQHG